MGKIIQPIGDRIIIPKRRKKLSYKIWMGLEDHFPPRVLPPKLSLNSILTSGDVHGPNPNLSEPSLDSGYYGTGTYEAPVGNDGISLSDNVVGQGFQIATNGMYLYSIKLFLDATTAGGVTVRWGNSLDLSIPWGEIVAQAVSGAASAWHEFVFDDTTNQLFTETQYYVAVRETSGDIGWIRQNTTDTYANGDWYAGGADWDLTGHNWNDRDCLFAIYKQ